MYDHYGKENQGITVIQQAIKNYLLSIGKEMAVICVEERPTMLDQQHVKNKTRIKWINISVSIVSDNT